MQEVSKNRKRRTEQELTAEYIAAKRAELSSALEFAYRTDPNGAYEQIGVPRGLRNELVYDRFGRSVQRLYWGGIDLGICDNRALNTVVATLLETLKQLRRADVEGLRDAA
jgi:hypothetical protein